MTREEIEKDFRIEHNCIQDAGKFEGQPFYAPYFWALYLNGSAVAIWETDEEYFQLDSDDLTEFPELKRFEYVILYSNDDGFVFVKALTERDFYDYMREVTGDEDYQRYSQFV